jgi:hypothetical protein
MSAGEKRHDRQGRDSGRGGLSGLPGAVGLLGIVQEDKRPIDRIAHVGGNGFVFFGAEKGAEGQEEREEWRETERHESTKARRHEGEEKGRSWAE